MAANREQIAAAAANEVCLRDESGGREGEVRTQRERETTVVLKEEVAERRTESEEETEMGKTKRG